MEYSRRNLDEPGVLTASEAELQEAMANGEAIPRHLRHKEKFVWKSADQQMREAEEADPELMAARIRFDKAMADFALLTVGLKKSPLRKSQQ